MQSESFGIQVKYGKLLSTTERATCDIEIHIRNIFIALMHVTEIRNRKMKRHMYNANRILKKE
jgi:hypothetical protein